MFKPFRSFKPCSLARMAAFCAGCSVLPLAHAGALAADTAANAEIRAARAAERTQGNVFKAWFPNLETARKAAVSLHGALLESDYAHGWQVFELDAAEAALLQRFGYRLEPALDFMQRRRQFLDALDAAPAARGAAGIQSIPGYACYATVEETFATAQAMASSRPELARWLDIGNSWQKANVLGGYDMRVLVLGRRSASARGAPKPRLFITSAIHAREYATAPLALAFAQWLLDGFSHDADATWLLENEEIHLLLQSNPDGRKMAEAGLSWRKNTNPHYCSPTSHNRGADLNRNFSFGWNSTHGEGSSGNSCSLVYRGPAAASEPETQAIEAYVRSLWPDRRGPGAGDAAPASTSGLHLDLHSYSDLVLWPWGDVDNPAPNAFALQTLGRRLAYFNGYTPMQSVGLYPTDGTSDGPSYGELGVAAFTIEMGSSFFENCSSFNSTVKPDNLRALIYAAKVARAPYLLPAGPEVGAVTLAGGAGAVVVAGTPVALSATLSNGHFNQSNGIEPVHAVAAAAAFIDVPPWAAGAAPIPLTPADGVFDSADESAAGTLSTAGLRAGRHLVYVQGSDASGRSGPVTAAFLDVSRAPLPAITLSLGTSLVQPGLWDVQLQWTGAVGAQVDVRLNGQPLASTANDGAYSERRGPGSWRYQVCQRKLPARCSAEQSVSF